MSIEFLPVAKPQSESELAVMVSLLEANGIQHFVHNRGFGGLYPGMQIELYNVRRLMVPAEQASGALELLSVFSQRTTTSEADQKLDWVDKLRVIFETIVFSWSVPLKRRKIQSNEENDI
jgi:hypothetical protein